MTRSTLLSSVAACLFLSLGVSQLAAQTAAVAAAPAAQPATAAPTVQPPAAAAAKGLAPIGQEVAAAKPSEACLNDLRAFDGVMEKDGYWLGGAGHGYGYPMGGIGYGYPAGGYAGGVGTGFRNARPGYEVRTLVTAANILARHGQKQACENVLTTTREIYSRYAADMRSGKFPKADVSDWRHQQIAAAKAVAATDTSFRSDQLLGTDVRNAKDEALGSVDDLIMSPQTGKIAYLVIARGGIFGIGEKYVPVPWADFKVPPNANLLVLAATKAAMDTAPQVKSDQFATPGTFDQESQKVDAYWKTHRASTTSN